MSSTVRETPSKTMTLFGRSHRGHPLCSIHFLRGFNVMSRNAFNSNTNVLSTRHNYDIVTIFEYTAMT